MKSSHLNSLVDSYQNGDELALVGIFDAVNPLIEKASSELELLVDNYAKFDCRIVMKVKRLIETFDIDKHDFLSAVKAIIGNEKAFLINRSKNKPARISKEKMEEGRDGEVGIELRSQYISVEDQVIFREKITLLAQGDERKTIILNQWLRGATDVSISQLLAQRFGGEVNTQWVFLKRFKKKCQRILADA